MRRKLIFLLKEAIVDYKWRLTIPSAVAERESLLEEDEVFITMKDDGCLEIYFVQPPRLPASSGALILQAKTVQNKNDGQIRLMIPASLRESTSFFYGRSITIADLGKKMELWPRPERRSENVIRE